MYSRDNNEKPLVPVKKKVTLPPNPMDDKKIGDYIGAFTGYNRRPKSTREGLMALFFGENGPEADVISALHLTHYQEVPAKVSVWLIKDKEGHSGRVNGEYPKIAEFIAVIRRPLATMYGQTAQLFGANGINADAINVLNKTEYVDALVYVEIQLADINILAKEIVTVDPSDEIKEKENILTPAELKEVKKQQRRAEEADNILIRNGFYKNPAILNAVGTDEEYKKWVDGLRCCQPGTSPCDHGNVKGRFFSQGKFEPYAYIPLCEQHYEEWKIGKTPEDTDIENFIETRKVFLNSKWVKFALKEKLGIPQEYEIPPKKLFNWLIDNDLLRYMPSMYRNFVE